jgi:hypothetical protein
MTDPPPAPHQATQPTIEQLHHLLLRADSRLPDELVVAARTWLADGHLLDVAQTVVFSCLTCDVPLPPADAQLLADILRTAGTDTTPVADLTRSGEDPMPAYRLAPVGPHALDPHSPAVPHTMDLTGPAHPGPGAPDDIDHAAIAAVADQTGTHALWRSWRYPTPQDQWPQATRGYLVQMAPGHEPTTLATTTARIQTTLITAGQTNPLVRVFTHDTPLPAFHRIALRFSALLWTAHTPPTIHLANDCSTTATRPDAPRLDEPERSYVRAYLTAGTPLLITTKLTQDPLDPTLAAHVPTNLHTDGEWVWTDAIRYYLDRYHLAPDDHFLAHIRRRGYQPAQVDTVALHRALAAVQPNPTRSRSRAEPADVTPTTLSR